MTIVTDCLGGNVVADDLRPPSDVGAPPCGAGGEPQEQSLPGNAESCGVVTREHIYAPASGGVCGLCGGASHSEDCYNAREAGEEG